MNEKICVQCCRQLPLTQFKPYKTKGGLKYRNYCHQCAYNNNRFNVLSKERLLGPLSEVDATIYDMTLQLFDTYSEMGGTIGSGAYNDLRNKTKKEATLEQQLAEAQQLLAVRNNPAEYTQENRYLKNLYIDELDNELYAWLKQSMEEWCNETFKPSFLRAISADLKQRLFNASTGTTEQNLRGLQTLATKIWDYEEYLVDHYKGGLPDWLKGEELIV